MSSLTQANSTQTCRVAHTSRVGGFTRIELLVVVVIVLLAVGLTLLALRSSRDDARRAQSIANLKEIASALRAYHEANDRFPPAVITEEGVPRSWRIEIVPFLGAEDLRRLYRESEPWDSSWNRRVLPRRPAAYGGPAAPDPTGTPYLAVTGRRPGEEPPEAGIAPPLGDLPDGASNTILVVEAGRDVPWTKPEDMDFDPDDVGALLSRLADGGRREGFPAAFADGSVRLLSREIDPDVFRSLVVPGPAPRTDGRSGGDDAGP